ncbi:MAG: helix-turn-helix domain-containing protein [Paludibacteraceae bacterium]|nr:helix-turn-helix domain-containing protein [Paludibacteraceae bacterium]
MDNFKNMQIYKNIRKFRKEKGMSQEELAHKVGYSGKSMVSKVEKGEVNLSDYMINKFAFALDVYVHELRGDSDEHWQYLEKMYETDNDAQLSDLDLFLKESPEYYDLFIECKKIKKENIQQVIAILKTFE